MSQSDQHEEAVFEAALKLPVDERAAYLEKTCSGDADLRRRVEALLGAFERSGGFMKQPASCEPTMRLSLPPTEKPGDRIGRYKLLEKIGEGGCGVVHVAEQEEPVRRRVALKIIKLGMDTKQVIARFEAERQALALMDHPNIAKVFDAGATETGRPFFVMELVRGVKITDHCEQHHLAPRARLDLFIQVCRAIQHAHQKGIIHRDVKPSNVLVASDDGVPVPKVIDFGIAKATQGRLTDQTVYTAFEQFIGTPAYMSPEQAALTLQDIDTRSDIYSLGVLLYELLTGTTPFDAKELLSKGLDEMRRSIREVEPVKPSTRLTQEQTSKSAIQDARTETKSAIRNPPSAIPSDLDWIVMKCLEKDRTRRYETANGLATDLARHLGNEPIIARPPSTVYRFQKSVQRNKLAFGAATAVALALVIGFVVSTAMFFKAQAEKKKAQTEAAKSQQVAQFLKDMLQGVSPWNATGRDTTLLREILDRTAERVGKDFTNQPAVEAEFRDTLGFVYQVAGSWDKAEAMHRRALAIRREVFGNEHPDVAASLDALAHAVGYEGRADEAEILYRDALAMRKKLLGNSHKDVANTLDALAKHLRDEGKLEEAEILAREHLALQKKLTGNESAEVAMSLYSLSKVLQYRGKLQEAAPIMRDALTMQKKFMADDLGSIGWTLIGLSGILEYEGKLTEAEDALREALAIHRRFFGGQHPEVAGTLRCLADNLQKQGKLAEAETLLREALTTYRKLTGEANPRTTRVVKELKNVLEREGKLSEANALGEAQPPIPLK